MATSEKKPKEKSPNEITLRQAIEYYSGLQCVEGNDDLPGVLSYRIGRNIARLKPLIKESQEQERKFRKKYGEVTTNAKGIEGIVFKTVSSREKFEDEWDGYIDHVSEEVDLFKFEESLFKLDAPVDDQPHIPPLFFSNCSDLIVLDKK